MRRRLVLVVAMVVFAHASAHADGLAPGRVCVERATVYDTPHGYTVAFLRRHTLVRPLRGTRDRRWVRVSTDVGIRGWVRAAQLCLRGS